MKVLFLGKLNNHMESIFRDSGDLVFNQETGVEDSQTIQMDFIVSYNYKHKIGKSILDKFPHRAVNLHLSFLPWNRGSHPNFWSHCTDTPCGVSIHEIDEGIDTGDVLLQKEIYLFDFPPEDFDWLKVGHFPKGWTKETLRTSHRKLSCTLEHLFYKNWMEIKRGLIKPIKQSELSGFPGSYHKDDDIRQYLESMPNGWDTPISWIYGLEGRRTRLDLLIK